jgi:hypothetical protein
MHYAFVYGADAFKIIPQSELLDTFHEIDMVSTSPFHQLISPI